jgi:hypothetical protein
VALPLHCWKRMTTPVARDSAQIHFRSTQAKAHPFCFVCSGANTMGLALRYGPRRLAARRIP